MALQTRFSELFRGAKKGASATALVQPLPPESISALRASAPPKPSRHDLAPRVSMTQFVGEHVLLHGSNDGATPGSVLSDGEVWECAAGTEAVDWWLTEGTGNAGSRALDLVMAQLTASSPLVERWERTGDVRTVVAEFTPLLAVIELGHVRACMEAVGLNLERLAELRKLMLAFIQLEAPGTEAESATLTEHACAVRAELAAACAWQLRGRRESSHLARITDSVNALELAMDLTELADLVSDNEPLFAGDQSLETAELTELAVTLACKLRARNLHSSPCVGHEWGLRAQVFSLLMDCAIEVQTAGCYALRHEPHWVRFFGPVRNVARPRSKLRDSLGR